ncbi:uncharacterized protein si:ch211-199g17.2 [Danio aesculapii]|uniref:uncharacterized protein si:ch211-199g17.2 n=1 Tax=Danio aesculapii TaxID=1142201 RepID=UPI0024C03D81|nr:uncharacterized protein si:ch211-199g17.2 [Danio aesculapii]
MFSSSCPAGGHSHLYNSLRPYLDNRSRAQPIIGLNSITEVLTHRHPAVYFCDVCFLRMTKADVRNHIMGSIHKYNYTKSLHEHGWRSDTDLTLLARHLMEIAKMVEKKEGTGDIQVLCVDEVVYKEITSAPLPDAFAQMKEIKKQPNPNARDLHVQRSQSKGNATKLEWQQMSGNVDGNGHLPTLYPTRYVSTIPSKCPADVEPQTVSTSSTPNALLQSVKPLLICQNKSTPHSLLDPHVPSRIPVLGSFISQHISQDQPHRNQSFQTYTMSSENQCLTQVWRVSSVRPPTQWSPVGPPCQNYMVCSGEENRNAVLQSFGVGYETHALRSAQSTPYQTPSYPVSNTVPKITQDLTNEYLGKERSRDGLEPRCDVETTSLMKPHSIGVLESAVMHPNQSHDQAYSQEPIHNNWKAHAEQENKYLLSQNPITQFSQTPQRPSDVDIVNHSGQKPLIGLQAVIKCQCMPGNPPSCFYLCQVCSAKMRKRKKIIKHLINPDHQRNYLKAHHPELLPKKSKPGLTIKQLEEVALHLEKKDGRAHIKVVNLPVQIFNDILQKDYQSCIPVVNSGVGVVWTSDLLSFNERNNRITGPIPTRKRPEIPPPSKKRPVEDQHEAPTRGMSKKIKTENADSPYTNANEVKETVFKVSLSLQAGPPIVIERAPLKDKTTIAPEIEGQNTHSQLCMYGCPHTVDTTTQQELTQTDHHTLTASDSEQLRISAQFDHTEQFSSQTERSQMLEDCGPVVTVERADWPEQNYRDFRDSQWQSRDAGAHAECAGYMQYWW